MTDAGFFTTTPALTADPMSTPERLNLRWHGLIDAQRDVIQGRRVLEAGCWNGRWLYAAYRAGAISVVGTESDREQARLASSALTDLGVPMHQFKIFNDDFYSLARGGGDSWPAIRF